MARKAASSTAGTPAASNATSAPPPVRSFTAFSASSGANTAVAPSSRASFRFASTGSTATIGYALATEAAITEARPTPPSPNTATDWPGRTVAVLRTAPAPVSTAQPKSAAVRNGTSGGTTTMPAGSSSTGADDDDTEDVFFDIPLPPDAGLPDDVCQTDPNADEDGDGYELWFTLPWDPVHTYDVEFEDGAPVSCSVND